MQKSITWTTAGTSTNNDLPDFISIIIPNLNDAGFLDFTLSSLRASIQEQENFEIIIADGGSSDKSSLIAQKHNAVFLSCPEAGRSKQMNFAAERAEGNILYFLHADSRPPRNFDQYIREAINEGYKTGCFTSRFDWAHPFLRLCNLFSRLPFWFCRGGGQSLFIKKDLFESSGGFNAEMEIMEEYEFIQRLWKHHKFRIIKKDVITSARDYRKYGAFRLQWHYSRVFRMYARGCDQNKMKAYLEETFKT